MEEKRINTWCGYCKDPIYDDDDYVIYNDKSYHVECFKQMTTYPSFDDE